MKKGYFTLILILATITLTIIGCDTYKQDSYVERYVIETFLTAGMPLSEVKLSTTVPFGTEYRFEDVAISGAEIVVNLLDGNGQTEAAYTFSETSQKGIYRPDDDTAVVLPGRRYGIIVTGLKNEGDRITATTFVPGNINLLEVSHDMLIYQGPDQFEFTFTTGFYPGRQNVYVATAFALEPDAYDLTPFWKEQEDIPGEFIRVSSGLINEGNYELNPDNTLTVKYPWLGISYYGPNELSIYAVDTNIYDYIRSFNIQAGGPTLSPGQIENVLWNVEGGIGIFGSRTGISYDVFVAPIP